MCYISMDSSRQALQNNEKLFSYFNFVFKLLAENKKKYLNYVNIDRSSTYCTSMDLTWQALQINEKLLSNFRIIFRISLLVISGVGFMHARGGGYLCWTARILVWKQSKLILTLWKPFWTMCNVIWNWSNFILKLYELIWN